MKINEKIFSYPPYISTTWNQVKSLYQDDSRLVVNLLDNAIITIPNLPDPIVLEIFAAHQKFLESKVKESQSPELGKLLGIPIPLPPGFEGTVKIAVSHLDGLAQSVAHNSENANAPDLPKELIDKMIQMTKLIGFHELEHGSKAEPHCNCPHCQVARVIQNGGHPVPLKESKEPQEEAVTERDLTFVDWDIRQLEPKLYTVTSRLDPNENYQVFLGSPIGCTCGKSGCEHILAVLKS
jgi:hypothetical protein